MIVRRLLAATVRRACVLAASTLAACAPTSDPPIVLAGSAAGCGVEAADVAPRASHRAARLRAVDGAARVYVGTAIDHELLAVDASYAALAAAEFDCVTPENAMKWGVVEPSPGVRAYAGADAIVAFAEANGMRVRGHTLVWHRQLPPHIAAGTLDADGLRAAMTSHVHELVTRYRGRVFAWDVVNEALADYGGGLRDSVFHATLGPGYVAEAFALAHAADPDAKLYYNDFYVEGPGEKTDAMVALLADLLADGVPIHGVGLQAHLVAGLHSPSRAELDATFARLEALGLEVAVTELDVQIAAATSLFCATPDDARMWQAVLYREIAATCVASPACVGLTTWGFTDRESWVDAEFQPDDPLLLDDADVRKPAYYGLLFGLGAR